MQDSKQAEVLILDPFSRPLLVKTTSKGSVSLHFLDFDWINTFSNNENVMSILGKKISK